MIKSVPDTNVIVSAYKGSKNSPNKEYLAFWEKGAFEILFSEDTLKEYIKKLVHFDIPEKMVRRFIAVLINEGFKVEIDFFHLRKYPIDQDDTAFLLCAVNGNATHLISYDSHLLELDKYFDFKICKTIPFLKALRSKEK